MIRTIVDQQSQETVVMLLATLLLFFATVHPHCDAKGRAKLRETAYLHDLQFCPGPQICKGFMNMDYLGRDKFKININCTYDQDYYPEKALVEVKKCTSRSMENCQDYISFPVDDPCQVVLNKNYYSTQFLWKIKPPFKSCPLKKGTYKVEDFDINPFIPIVKNFLNFDFNEDNSFNSFEVKLYSKIEVIFCLRMGMTFQLSRVTEGPPKTST